MYKPKPKDKVRLLSWAELEARGCRPYHANEYTLDVAPDITNYLYWEAHNKHAGKVFIVEDANPDVGHPSEYMIGNLEKLFGEVDKGHFMVTNFMVELVKTKYPTNRGNHAVQDR